jgi:hypothetical protein
MASEPATTRRAPLFVDPPGSARHRPEETLLYQLVERHYPDFVAMREAADRPLPKYVQEEFEASLKCGRLEHGFLRTAVSSASDAAIAGRSARRRAGKSAR